MVVVCSAMLMMPGAATAFRRASISGVSNLVAGTNGMSIVDLNRDGRLDLILAQSPPARTNEVIASDPKAIKANQISFLIATGPLTYREHKVTIKDHLVVSGAERQGPQVPNFADFNNDGFLDLFLTRHAVGQARQRPRGAESLGCSLYLSEGAWDKFVDVSKAMGVRNEDAYNRQSSIGDVNRDGWLDIAVGCDNIGNAGGGIPHSRLYVFQPKGSNFSKGTFKDIGGTELVPDFGGFYHDSKRDKAGPDITLRDLDNDGDLDLIQDYHIDIRDPRLPYSPVEYRQGNFNWKNLLETGTFKFEKVVGNGFANEAKLKWNGEKSQVEIDYGKAPGLPYVTTADFDNDGDQDILAVGPSDTGWSARAEYVGGRFWRNDGSFKFKVVTDEVGLESLNWTYRKWLPHDGVEIPSALANARPFGFQVQTSGLPRVNPLDNRPYYSDCLFGDIDNDGWIDLIVMDRREGQLGLINGNTALYLNKGGRFELQPASVSGFNASGIGGEIADLNNDGFLDFFVMADPDNTGGGASADRYQNKVFINSQSLGKDNHWLRLRFSGVTDAELIGARVSAFDGSKRIGTRWIHTDHSYKSSGALEAHFGLGKVKSVNLEVELPSGRKVAFKNAPGDRFLDFDLKNKRFTEVKVK
jgi:hypothetical protein